MNKETVGLAMVAWPILLGVFAAIYVVADQAGLAKAAAVVSFLAIATVSMFFGMKKLTE